VNAREEEGKGAHLEGVVQVLEHDDLVLGVVAPQVDAAESDADRRVERAAAQDEDDAALVEEALHPDERLGRREVDTYGRSKAESVR